MTTNLAGLHRDASFRINAMFAVDIDLSASDPRPFVAPPLRSHIAEEDKILKKLLFYSVSISRKVNSERALQKLSPSIHKFGDEFIHSGLSAALGHELGPNGVSNFDVAKKQNTSLYSRIEALSDFFKGPVFYLHGQ
jgi:hypothetical protein